MLYKFHETSVRLHRKSTGDPNSMSGEGANFHVVEDVHNRRMHQDNQVLQSVICLTEKVRIILIIIISIVIIIRRNQWRAV